MATNHHANTVASRVPSLKGLLTTIPVQIGSVLLTFAGLPLWLARFDTKVLTVGRIFVQ
jgi:hypothetical protein